MSVGAHTNKPGRFELWKGYATQYRSYSGPVYNGTQVQRDAFSDKPNPSRPAWIRNPVTGAVDFKKPSPYYRTIERRSSTQVKGVEYAAGKAVGEYETWAHERMGNHSDNAYIPRVIYGNSDRPIFDNNQIWRAETECLLKFNDQKAAIGAAFAEAVSTANMFSDTASRLARGLLAMKRGNALAAYKALFPYPGVVPASKWVANHYLQWKFGWAPLMQDMRGYVDLLKEQIDTSPKLVRAVRRLTDESSGSFLTNAHLKYPNEVTYKGTSRVQVKLWAAFQDSYWRNTVHGLGLDNPLTILWEVTPWSFVVDWVAPVGNVLQALTATQGLDFVGGCCTVTAEGVNRIKVPAHQDRVRYHENDSEVVIQRFATQRVAYTGFPFPKPYLKSPFSTSHTNTAIALLTQLATKALR